MISMSVKGYWPLENLLKRHEKIIELNEMNEYAYIK